MTILPCDGKEQTKAPSPTQIQCLERVTHLDCSSLNCTRSQANRWLGIMWSDDRAEKRRLKPQVLNEMLALGAK